MPVEPITLELIDRATPTATAVVTEYARRLRGLRYCDVRLEVAEHRSSTAEDGKEKRSAQDYRFNLGVRVLAGDPLAAPATTASNSAPPTPKTWAPCFRPPSATHTSAPWSTPAARAPPAAASRSLEAP